MMVVKRVESLYIDNTKNGNELITPTMVMSELITPIMVMGELIALKW